MELKTETKKHIVWLDVVRLAAILMVIGVHCIDPFYISPTMRDIPEYTRWASIYGSLFRPSVPLFAMMTGLLLLPVGQPLGAFYKKRIFRILFPVVIWSVLYNLFPWFTGVLGLDKSIIGDFFCYTQGSESQALGDSLRDVAMIPFQFSFKENHMWYMYLLIGLYLYMPFFSAWIEKAAAKEKRVYLGIWFASLFIPYATAYVAPWFGVGYLFGESTWNAFGMFYYFAGFNGYLVLGHYLKKGNGWSFPKTLAISAVLFGAGYWVTYSGFQKVRINGERVARLLANITKCGFGIYIVHYFLVGPFFLLIGPSSLPIPLQVPLMSVCIFLVAWGFTALMYRLLGKKAVYIMG